MEQSDLYRPLDLGGLIIPGRLVLAPMAGITDDIMRLLCHRYGAAMAYTEMVSAKGLLMSEKSRELLAVRGGEGPVAAQLFGRDPVSMAEAARYIEQSHSGGIAMIDINMGCPAHKITGSGEGSALLKDLPLAGRIMESVVRAVGLPVGVKMRIGYFKEENVAVKLAKIAAQSGICAVTVHGRTKEQGYAGRADWGAVAAVKDSVGQSLAVIGNGDVTDIRQAGKYMGEYGCDGIMIGRAAIGRPWVFCETIPQKKERLSVIKEHLMLEMEKRGKERAIKFMRKILAAYVHGIPGATHIRARIFKATDYETVWAAVMDGINGMPQGQV